MLTYHLSYVLCIAAELLYPTYASFKAIQTETAQDDMQWLTFWIVNSFIRTLEVALRPVIVWIPLYYELRLGLYIWLIAPQTMGALFLYERYISPFLSRYGAELDPVFAKTTRFVQKAGAAAAKLQAAAHGDSTFKKSSTQQIILGQGGSESPVKPSSSDGQVKVKLPDVTSVKIGGSNMADTIVPGKVKAT